MSSKTFFYFVASFTKINEIKWSNLNIFKIQRSLCLIFKRNYGSNPKENKNNYRKN